MVNWFLVAILAALSNSIMIMASNKPAASPLLSPEMEDAPSVISSATDLEDEHLLCETAHLKCAYRKGCGMALKSYMLGCSDVISGVSDKCSEHCKHALIALTSTDEGQRLMTCECTDEFCLQNKRRIEVCRPDVVMATHNASGLSCRVAQWICDADPLCSTALDYYHLFCRTMFQGKKCTHRCNNSISILRRQDKATQLGTCVCDGNEDFDCKLIRRNMDRLCFHKKPIDEEQMNEIDESTESNRIPTSSASKLLTLVPSGYGFFLLTSLWAWTVAISSRWDCS